MNMDSRQERKKEIKEVITDGNIIGSLEVASLLEFCHVSEKDNEKDDPENGNEEEAVEISSGSNETGKEIKVRPKK